MQAEEDGEKVFYIQRNKTKKHCRVPVRNH